MLGLMDGRDTGACGRGDGHPGSAGSGRSSRALLEALGPGDWVVGLLPSIDNVQLMMRTRPPSAGGGAHSSSSRCP
ncbi:MAG: hypothetical protein WDW38_008791 [Sanguina aurantia]